MAMENAKLDHADRNSEQSGITVETATEEYNRVLELAKAAGVDLESIQVSELCSQLCRYLLFVLDELIQ